MEEPGRTPDPPAKPKWRGPRPHSARPRSIRRRLIRFGKHYVDPTSVFSAIVFGGVSLLLAVFGGCLALRQHSIQEAQLRPLFIFQARNLSQAPPDSVANYDGVPLYDSLFVINEGAPFHNLFVNVYTFIAVTDTSDKTKTAYLLPSSRYFEDPVIAAGTKGVVATCAPDTSTYNNPAAISLATGNGSELLERRLRFDGIHHIVELMYTDRFDKTQTINACLTYRYVNFISNDRVAKFSSLYHTRADLTLDIQDSDYDIVSRLDTLLARHKRKPWQFWKPIVNDVKLYSAFYGN